MNNKAKQEEFLELLDPLHNRLMRFCRAITRTNEEAKDIASETLLQAFENFEKLKKKESFRSYLFQIASRINKRRQWRKRLFLENDGNAAELVSSDPAPDKALLIEELYKALALLPQKQKEALVLFEISGFSLDEIREIQGGTLSGVKSRLKRGREKLTQLLQEDEIPFENGHFSGNGNAAGSNFDQKKKIIHKVKNG